MKKLYIRSKQVVWTLVLIYLVDLHLNIKQKYTDPETFLILIFMKGSGTSFTTTFCVWSFLKNICYTMMSRDNKPASWDEQVSLSGCLYFLSYWTICILQLFVSQTVISKILKLTSPFLPRCFLTWAKIFWQKFKYVENKKELLTWEKKYFSLFLKAFSWCRWN